MSRESRILTHRTHRQRHTLPLSLFILLGAWIGLWLVTANQLNKQIDHWVESAKENDTLLTFNERYTDGSPWKLHVHVKNFAFKHPKGHRIEADEVIFYLPLWNWKNISAKMKGLIRGQLFEQSFVTEALKIGLTPHDTKSYDTIGLDLWIHAVGLTPHLDREPLLGRRIAKLTLETKITGPIPSSLSEDNIRIWSSNGGHLTIDEVNLEWGGLTLTGNGSITLNQKLQPEGVFSSKLTGLPYILAACKRENCLSPMETKMLKVSLNVLARPSGVSGNSSPVVPLSIQHGGLYLGPVKISAIPKINW